MEQASFENAEHDGRPMLRVAGELDLAVAADLRNSVERAIARAHSLVLVDLAAVTFMDSSCLGVLVGCQRTADASGIELVVVSPSPAARKVLELAGVDQLIKVRDEP